jgi:hypothetical protein
MELQLESLYLVVARDAPFASENSWGLLLRHERRDRVGMPRRVKRVPEPRRGGGIIVIIIDESPPPAIQATFPPKASGSIATE